ncbi:hypothetical protein DFH08DRAFT_69235 [Mycena albidolilacea]|uniref:Uncharacterized protein n=1 Tax=Mycena albidolilacea TaxID=1033008 RepID=A0AAD7ABI8_9AGAR|nr:hypothetical protein DFH08DRAFT_69235 [Mycena albidolilacea]
MWTTSAGITNVPAGTSAFRLTFHPSPVFPLANITIAITTDNAYNLYFNNTLVGSSIDWPTPNVWTILNVPSNGPWIFAVLATNFQQTTINPAGVIASFRASNDAQQAFYNWWTGQIASPSVVWKAMSQAPNDFAQPSLNDSTWPSAVILTPYGGGQWGFLPAPVAKTLCG